MADGISMRIKVVDNRLPGLAAKLPIEVDQALGRVAFDIERGAKQRCPVDTGHLRNSIRTEHRERLRWTVGTHVEYGVYIEHGTRYMAAQPFLGPAAEQGRKRLQAEVSKVIEKAARAAV